MTFTCFELPHTFSRTLVRSVFREWVDLIAVLRMMWYWNWVDTFRMSEHSCRVAV